MDLIDGREIREEILKSLQNKIEASNIKPSLIIILVGDNKASVAYVRQKKLAGEKIGASVKVDNLATGTTQDELKKLIINLNKDQSVHGIILQLPIPEHLDPDELSQLISPEKDVDGFVIGSRFKPATAMGVVELLKRSGVNISGSNVVVVGRGKIAGRPTAELLRKEGAHVEVVHSKTENPAEITKKADILVSAVGKPKLITAGMVKAGAVVVDIGTTPVYPKADDVDTKERISGDVDFENVSKIASKITPVPGGVGPMTVAALMQNLVRAAKVN